MPSCRRERGHVSHPARQVVPLPGTPCDPELAALLQQWWDIYDAYDHAETGAEREAAQAEWRAFLTQNQAFRGPHDRAR
jgi:hypothetical protein